MTYTWNLPNRCPHDKFGKQLIIHNIFLNTLCPPRKQVRHEYDRQQMLTNYAAVVIAAATVWCLSGRRSFTIAFESSTTTTRTTTTAFDSMKEGSTRTMHPNSVMRSAKVGSLACLEGIAVVNRYSVPSKETEIVIIHDLFVRLLSLLLMIGRSPWFLLLFSN